uniref:Uncharacterized protein n=1 Tax=Lepeophtheirus salmonis TaxID=72036 RepID=A0A0K2VAE4_LEPSM
MRLPRLIEIQGYTITRVRLMFDFHHAFNIDVIVDECLRVLLKSACLAQQSVQNMRLKIVASPIT